MIIYLPQMVVQVRRQMYQKISGRHRAFVSKNYYRIFLIELLGCNLIKPIEYVRESLVNTG